MTLTHFTINFFREGNSGVRVGIAGSGEPVWTDFGENYADFVYTDDVGGTLEVKMSCIFMILSCYSVTQEAIVSPDLYAGSIWNL